MNLVRRLARWMAQPVARRLARWMAQPEVRRLARWMVPPVVQRPAAAANAVLAVVLAGVLAREAYDIAAYHRAWLPDVGVALAVGAAALLRERGRARAAAAGLAVAAAAELAAWLGHLPGQPGGAAAVALLVLVGSAVRVLPVRPAAVIAAAALAVGIGSYDLPSGSFAEATRLLATGWGVAVAAGLWLRFLDVRHRVALDAVRRGERLDLARELHDAAAHHITGIVIQAQAARIAARRDAEPLDRALAGIESAGTDALAAMRQVIGLLRAGGDAPGAADAAGLSPAPEQLADLVDRFAGRGPAVRLRLPDAPAEPAWPPEVATTVYRVVQESLTNIARHAGAAREVTVTLAHDRRAITVEVTDDAPAASSPRFPHAGGYGLVGMRERVEALGGTLSAGPRPAAGWSVLAALPAPGRP
jgi:signal transduction histidine kinase